MVTRVVIVYVGIIFQITAVWLRINLRIILRTIMDIESVAEVPDESVESVDIESSSDSPS